MWVALSGCEGKLSALCQSCEIGTVDEYAHAAVLPLLAGRLDDESDVVQRSTGFTDGARDASNGGSVRCNEGLGVSANCGAEHDSRFRDSVLNALAAVAAVARCDCNTKEVAGEQSLAMRTSRHSDDTRHREAHDDDDYERCKGWNCELRMRQPARKEPREVSRCGESEAT